MRFLGRVRKACVRDVRRVLWRRVVVSIRRLRSGGVRLGPETSGVDGLLSLEEVGGVPRRRDRHVVA